MVTSFVSLGWLYKVSLLVIATSPGCFTYFLDFCHDFVDILSLVGTGGLHLCFALSVFSGLCLSR